MTGSLDCPLIPIARNGQGSRHRAQNRNRQLAYFFEVDGISIERGLKITTGQVVCSRTFQMASSCISRQMGYISLTAIARKDNFAMIQCRSIIGQFWYSQCSTAAYFTGRSPDAALKGSRTRTARWQLIGKSSKIGAGYIHIQIEYGNIPIDAYFT